VNYLVCKFGYLLLAVYPEVDMVTS